MTARRPLSAIIAVFLAFILAFGLVPLVSGSTQYAEATEGSQPLNLVEGTYAEGEALVLLADSAGGISARSNVLDGYTIENTWDFTVPDEAADPTSDAIARPLSLLDEEPDSLSIALVKKDGADTATMIAELEAMPDVLAAEPNYLRAISSYDPASDPFYETGQWSLGNGTTSHPAAKGIDFEAAFDALEAAGKTTSAPTTSSPIVAVIDTGVDYTNPDLAGVMWNNPGTIGLDGQHGYDFGTYDDDPMPDGTDYVTSHGTHCAGSIAAQTGNGEGITGTSANQARIMALKVSDATAGIYDDSCIGAFAYVLKAKMAGENVVATNCSWGGPSYSAIIDFAIDQIGRAGVITFIAAGNDGMDVGPTPNHPADTTSPYAIVVASADPDGTLSNFTNYNETIVDVAIGGSSILSTLSANVGEHYISSVGATAQPGTPTTQKAVNYALHDFDGYPDIATAIADLGLVATYHNPDGSANLGVPVTLDLVSGGFQQNGHSQQLAVTADFEPNGFVELSLSIPNPFASLSAADVPEDLYLGFMGKRQTPASGVLSAQAAVKLVGDTGSVEIAAMPSHQYSDVTYKLANPAALAGGSPTLEVKLVLLPVNQETQTTTLYLDDLGLGTPTGNYGIMSGTSMATPTLAGCYAALCSLHGDVESPLELRGRLIGSTESLVSAEQGKIASGGRFVFDEAVQAAGALNPTSYALTFEDGAATLHGRALDGATVTIDSTPASATAAPDGMTTSFDASAYADNAYHRVDVEKNGHTYKARYFFPDDTAETQLLERISDVPFELSSSMLNYQRLLTDGDVVYFAGDSGEAVYSYNVSTGAWTNLPSAEGIESGHASNLYYLAANGELYAVDAYYTTNAPQAENPIYTMLAWLYRYDAAAGAWESLGDPFAVDGLASADAVQAGTYNGRIALASSSISEEDTLFGLLLIDPVAMTSEVIGGPTDTDGTVCDFGYMTQLGDFLISFGTAEEGISQTRQFVPYVFDGTAWTEKSPSNDIPAIDSPALCRYHPVADGERIHFIGDSLTSYGTLFSYDPAADAWETSPYSADPAKPVLGATVLGDSYYAILSDSPESPLDTSSVSDGIAPAAAATAGLYRMPSASNLHEVAVTAGDGGTASGGNWAEASSVLVGDGFTASALPKAGYSFSGWYAPDNTLLSSDAVWTFPVTGAATIEARFTYTGGPGGDPDPGGSDKPGSTLAKVGDPHTILPAVIGLASLAALALSFAVRRRGKSGR